MGPIIDELKAKRDQLQEGIREATATVKRLAADIAAIEHVIRVYDPAYKPEKGLSNRSRRRSDVQLPEKLETMNKSEALLDALREAAGPMTTAECTASILAREGISLDGEALSVFTTRVSASLNSLEKRGRVRRAGSAGRNRHLWEVNA